MIAGELEQFATPIHDWESHDAFWKKKTPEQKAANKEKRKTFFNKLGQGYQKAGGIEGILGTAGNVINFFQKPKEPSNMEVKLGTPPEQEPKGIPREVLILGGLVVLVAAGWGFSQYNKRRSAAPINNRSQPTKT